MVLPEQKGLCLDDTTLRFCPGKIPVFWPNTEQKVTSLRIFSSWQGFWPSEGREEAWEQLVSVVRKHGIKVLIGTQITCVEDDDDKDWQNVLHLISRMGAEHIMGVSLGNELELLWQKEYVVKDPTCIPRIWKGGYLWRQTLSRARDLAKLGPSFAKIPLTSVFGAYALAGEPFVNDPKTALVADYLRNATRQFGSRWAFALNIYPYFDPGNFLDADGVHCTAALQRSLCWSVDGPKTDPNSCLLIGTMARAREKMKVITGNANDTFWIGESGWSYPRASTLATPVRTCQAFSSKEVFYANYKRFLQYNMSLLPGMKGPDHFFFFTMRDSLNFGFEEHFGLIDTCDSKECKLQMEHNSSDMLLTV